MIREGCVVESYWLKRNREWGVRGGDMCACACVSVCFHEWMGCLVRLGSCLISSV